MWSYEAAFCDCADTESEEINVRMEVALLFPVDCGVLLIERSDSFRTKIASPFYKQLQLGLTLSLMMLVKIALFSAGLI